MKTYAVIMAGGVGERFWPMSRKKTPKQLLNLSGNDYMINETIARLEYITERDNMFIVTNDTQLEGMKEVTKGLIDPSHIISEPAGRGTAACIGLAAMEILKKYEDGVMIVTPSDAYIKDAPAYARALTTAIKAAETDDKLVTIGVTPTFAATGYGYIEYDKNEAAAAKTVSNFREKPDEATAMEYYKSGNYAWNSGVFVWKASLIMDKFAEYAKDIYEELVKIGDCMNTPKETTTTNAIYPNIRKTSVDYAVMEPSSGKGDVLVVPAEFGWNDIGSWDMMCVLHEEDEAGNILIGDAYAAQTTNSTIYSTSRYVGVVGVDNIVVVETKDSVMVCRKDKAQDVKLITENLKSSGREELL